MWFHVNPSTEVKQLHPTVSLSSLSDPESSVEFDSHPDLPAMFLLPGDNMSSSGQEKNTQLPKAPSPCERNQTFVGEQSSPSALLLILGSQNHREAEHHSITASFKIHFIQARTGKSEMLTHGRFWCFLVLVPNQKKWAHNVPSVS